MEINRGKNIYKRTIVAYMLEWGNNNKKRKESNQNKKHHNIKVAENN